MMRYRACLLWLPLMVVAFWATPAASVVTIDWVTIDNPGNACDTQTQGCFGAVAYAYQIGQYEVTNTQYAAFLNAVAATDTNGLYNGNMGGGALGGITQSGSTGSFSYSVKSGYANKPVNFVSFYDSLRFVNWLYNGQPTGVQGSGTTESGAYTITAAAITANSITRNALATIFLSSEQEWYKAAYYHAGSASYFDYPAGTNTQTVCAAPGATANTANCNSAVATATDEGAYTGSASPYGTFDQGGNVREWVEAILLGLGTSRVERGGAFADATAINLAASTRITGNPIFEGSGIGFRVARLVPPPPLPLGDIAAPAVAGLLLMTGLLGLAYRQRRHGNVEPGVHTSRPGAR